LRRALDGVSTPGWSQLPARIDGLIARAEELGQTLELQGPTGESNTLVLEPRGVVVCLIEPGAAEQDMAVPVLAALLAGNTTLIAAPAPSSRVEELRMRLVEAGFPAAALAVLAGTGVTGIGELIRKGAISAVATGGCGKLSIPASRALAQRDGAVLPLLEAEDLPGRHYLARFCYEKSITVNTTASGGNAELMAQGESE
jgi:RHH-type proline utilization regulon transcriptional repressor/proline dehydrogenase/delta 1-pyrroline-5-carboxylate dehydrogenase